MGRAIHRHRLRRTSRARSSSSTGTIYMSNGNMFTPLAQYSSRTFAEGHRVIHVYTRQNSYELRVFAVDVLEASNEGKRSDIADATELNTYSRNKLSLYEVVLEKPTDIAQACTVVTCSYRTVNSRKVAYATDSIINRIQCPNRCTPTTLPAWIMTYIQIVGQRHIPW